MLEIKKRRSILSLLVASLICSAVCLVGALEHTFTHNASPNIITYATKFPPADFILAMLDSAAPILLFLYVLKYHTSRSTYIILPTAIALIPAMPFVQVMLNLIVEPQSDIYGVRIDYLAALLIFDITILFVLLAVLCAKKLPPKIFVAITLGFGYFFSGYSFLCINMDYYYSHGLLFSMAAAIMRPVGEILLYTAVAILMSHSRHMTPEQELLRLRDEYENGLLSDEDYQSKRSAVIESI